jgi:hypothetical protein
MKQEQANRKEEATLLDYLNPAEKKVLTLILAGKYSAAATLTHQQNWLKHMTVEQLAAVYEKARQIKIFKKVAEYYRDYSGSKNKNFPFILCQFTKNQGLPSHGPGSKLRKKRKRSFPDQPSGDRNLFSDRHR